MRRNVASGWEGLTQALRQLQGRRVQFYFDTADELDDLSMPGGVVEGTGKLARAVVEHGLSVTIGDVAILLPRDRFRTFRTIYATDEPGGEPFVGWYEVYLESGVVFFLQEVRS
jgi:hypothetical protein